MPLNRVANKSAGGDDTTADVVSELQDIEADIETNGVKLDTIETTLNAIETALGLPLPVKDPHLEASLGNVTGYATVNKFAHATDVDTNATDIWDGADGTTSTKVWAPPTQARVHQITSTSTADIVTTGTGARTIRVHYLADWDTAEQTVDLNMNGTGNVATPSCVMINRMQCLTWGTGGVNAGVITATADTDGTITSAILTGENQTQQICYGIPSTQKLRIHQSRVSIIRSGGGGGVTFEGGMYFMPDPATNVVNNTAWIQKEHLTAIDDVPWLRTYPVPKKFDGPGIFKIQGEASSVNTEVIALFDACLVDN